MLPKSWNMLWSRLNLSSFASQSRKQSKKNRASLKLDQFEERITPTSEGGVGTAFGLTFAYKINGDDADTSPGVEVAVNDTPTLRYEVSLSENSTGSANDIFVLDYGTDRVAGTDDDFFIDYHFELAGLLGGTIQISDDSKIAMVTQSGNSFNVGDLDSDGFLDAQETWIFEYSGDKFVVTEATTGTQRTANVEISNSGDASLGSPSVEDSAWYNAPENAAGNPDVAIDAQLDGADYTTAPGKYYIVPDTGTFTYSITNPGDVPLNPISVIDDAGTPGDTSDDFALISIDGTGSLVFDSSFSGDTGGDQQLDIGETWTFSRSENVATGEITTSVEAIFQDAKSGTDEQVNATDFNIYTGLDPNLNLDVLVNGQSDTSETEPVYVLAGQDNVTYTLNHTTTGNTPIDNVQPFEYFGPDDFQELGATFQGSDGTTGTDGALDPGETYTFTLTELAQSGLQRLEGIATGTELNTGTPVTSNTDEAFYFGAVVDVNVDMKINGEDNDVAPGYEVLVGNNVPFTYFVTSDSNLPVAITGITDDNGTPGDTSDDFVPTYVSGDTNDNGLLDENESWEYEASKSAELAGPYQHTVSVSVFEVNSGGTDSATDSAFYFGVDPSVSITSQVNGEDADVPADSVAIEVGDDANFTYFVTNTGNRPLTNVVVTDDNGTPGDTSDDFNPTFVGGDDGDGVLEFGEVWEYEAAKTVPSVNDFVHVASVSATEPITATDVDDDNLNHYNGVASINPALDLTKYVSIVTDSDFDANNFTPVDDRGEDTTVTTYTLDFEQDDDGNDLSAGTRISDQWSDWGGLEIKTIINGQDRFSQYPPMIFDSANPTGGDNDLATPGYHSSNTVARENVLIISEDNDASDPDDKASGGMLEFTWTSGVDLDWIGLLDLDANETGNLVITYDADGNVLETLSVQPPPGDNSWAEVVFQNSDGAYRMEVYFPRSGAVTDLVFSSTSESRELFDANEEPGVTAEVDNGLIFDFDVTNTGDVSLTNVVVNDDNATPGDTSDDFAALPVESDGFNVGDANTNGYLDPGETWFFQSAANIESGDQGQSFTNTAVATADVYLNGTVLDESVQDQDVANWNVPAAPQFEGFAQDSNGLISIDVNNYDNHVSQGGKSWVNYSSSSASGGNALTTSNSGVNRNNNYETHSPRLDYKVVFNRTGTHYLWIRGKGASGNDDSIHAGIDGNGVNTADRISSFGTSWTWSKSTMDNVRATINVTSVGEHTINLWMREDGFVVDKVIVTSDPNYIPYGVGPSESPRAEDGTAAAPQEDSSAQTGVHVGNADANGNLTMFWEAEAFYSNSGFDVNDDGSASGGQYVGTSNGTGTSYNSVAVDQEIVYKVDLDQADEFHLFGLTRSPSSDDNSFWVQVDDGDWILWDTTVSGDWTWDEVRDRNDTGRRSFSLSEGEHTIRIRLREDGTQLDQLMLTNDTSFQPGS